MSCVSAQQSASWHLVLANVVSESSLDAIIGLKVDVQPVCMWLCGLQDRRWSWKDRTCFACTVTRSMPSTPATSTNQWSTEVNSDVHIIHTTANYCSNVCIIVCDSQVPMRTSWRNVICCSVPCSWLSSCFMVSGRTVNFILHCKWKRKSG